MTWRARLVAAVVAVALWIPAQIALAASAGYVLPSYFSVNPADCPSSVDRPCAVPYVGGNNSSLNITASAVVKASPGRLLRITVVAATASAAITVNDITTTAGAAAANQFFTIPSGTAAGTVFYLDWPCLTGIVIAYGSATGTLAVSFN